MGMMRPADPIAGAEAAAKRAYHAQLYEESVLELQAGVERVRQWHGPRTFKSTRATVIIGRKVRSEYMDWNWSRPKDGGDARPTPAALVDLDAMLSDALQAHVEMGGWDPTDDLSCCCCPFACTTGPCRAVYDPRTCCLCDVVGHPQST